MTINIRDFDFTLIDAQKWRHSSAFSLLQASARFFNNSSFASLTVLQSHTCRHLYLHVTYAQKINQPLYWLLYHWLYMRKSAKPSHFLCQKTGKIFFQEHTSPIALNIWGIFPQYSFAIFAIFANISSTSIIMKETLRIFLETLMTVYPFLF